MKKNILKFFLVFVICSLQFAIYNFSFAQDVKTAGEIDAENALKNYQHGIELMKKENYKGAMEAFNDAVDLDSTKSNYQFQLSLANYYSKNFETSVKVLKNIMKKFQADVRYYDLMGECYSEMRNDKKAQAILEEGLKKFPKSGSIHSQLGRIEYSHKNLNTALQYWELGMVAEPMFPSNYYFAAQAIGTTSERMWAIIYGEIFVNLETNTERTYEILFRLNDWYKQSFIIKNPKNKYALFTDERMRITEAQFKDTMLFHKNFPMAYNNIAQRSLIVFKDKVTTESLMKFRSKFITLWYSKNFPIDFPNPIFDYQRTVISADFFDCYNYWLFSKGDPKSFNDWMEKNKKKYDQFIKWFMAHPLELNADNVITRATFIKQ
jgi:tetratricopeptide (TPR) repeat protein